MANYMASVTSLSNSGLCIPGHQLLCLALGLVGLACMAWGLSIVLRTAEGVHVVEFETDRD